MRIRFVRPLLSVLAVVASLTACNEVVAPTAQIAKIRAPGRDLVTPLSPSPMLAGHDANSTCALSSTGVITCWGLNTYGQTVAPTSGGPFVQISLGYFHGCALTSIGGVVCWGSTNLSGIPLSSITPPSDISNVAQIAVGGGRTCVLKTDGTVGCWGFGDFQMPAGLSGVTQIDAGGSSVCALKSDGTVVCWGADYGQVTTPPGLNSVVQISAAVYTNCALKSDGTVVCWGPNDNGQNDVPADLSGVVEVSTGEFHTCALKSDGTVVCWGGITGFGMANVPEGLSGVRQIVSGVSNSCALKNDGSVVCWGSEPWGTAPEGLNLGSTLPVVTTTTATSTPINQQYSDETNLSATVTAEGADVASITGTVQFKVDGVAAGSPQTVVAGVATLANYVLSQTAGPHVLTAEFASTSEGFLNSVSPDGVLFVQFEDAVVTANPANPTLIYTGGSGTASAVLVFDLTEKQPDLAGVVAHAGDAANLTVRFNLASTALFALPVPMTCSSSPSGSGYNSVNTMTCNTGELAPGTYRVFGFPGTRFQLTSILAGVVRVVAPTTTPSVTASQQYSDLVNLTAHVSPEASTGAVQFQIDGVNVGTPQAVVAGTATLPNYRLTQASGTHSVTGQFTSSSTSFGNSQGTANFTVVAEAATIAAANGNAASVNLSGKATTASVSFSFTFTETQPDVATVGALSGDLNLLVPVVVLHPTTGASDVVLSCANKLTGTGYKASVASKCTSSSVPLGDYEIMTSVAGGYYTGTRASPFSVLPAKGKP